MNRYSISTFGVWGLVCAAAFAEGPVSPESIERQAAPLGSERLEERIKAFEALERRLAALEKSRESDRLRKEADVLDGLGKRADDPEFRDKIGRLLDPYRSGGVIWERGRALPGPVEYLQAIGARLLAGGSSGGKGWIGVYDGRTGSPIWEKETGDRPASSSLYAVHEKGIVCGAPPGWETVHYDLETGRELWKTPHPMANDRLARFMSLDALLVHDGTLIWGGGFNGPGLGGWMQLYQLETGKPLWGKRRQELPGSVALIRVLPGRRLLAAGALSKERQDGCGNDVEGLGWVGCYELDTGKKLWERGPGEVPSPLFGGTLQVEGKRLLILGNDFLAVGKDGKAPDPSATLALLDVETGKTAWRKKLPGSGEFVAQGDRLFLNGGRLEGKGFALQALDLQTGRLLWEGPRARSFLLVGDRIVSMVIGENDESADMLCHDAQSGKLLWNRRSLPSAPILIATDGRIVAVQWGGNGGFCAAGYDPETGRVIWESKGLKCPEQISHIVLLPDDRIVIGGSIHGQDPFHLGGGEGGESGWIKCVRCKGLVPGQEPR